MMKIRIDYGDGYLTRFQVEWKEKGMDEPDLPPPPIPLCQEEELIGEIRETVVYLFRRVLKRKLPKLIQIEMREEDKPSGSFRGDYSSESEITILLSKRLLCEKNLYPYSFHTTLVHELMHAADVDSIQKASRGVVFLSSNKKLYEEKADRELLHRLSWMLDHYRREGIAVLGTYLLSKETEKSSGKDIRSWRYDVHQHSQFDPNIGIEELEKQLEKVMGAGAKLPKTLQEETKHKGYMHGGLVVLRVLRTLGMISADDERRVSAYIRVNGRCELDADSEPVFPEFRLKRLKLSFKDRARVLNACFTLTFPMFIEGLLLCRDGNPRARAELILGYCCKVQGCYPPEKVSVFIDMVTSSTLSAADFNRSMRVLAGQPLKEEDLVRRLNGKAWEQFLHCQNDITVFQSKTNRLYALYQEHSAAGRRQQALVANHALHYFLRIKDMIPDYVPVFGLVDDMVVMDLALGVLEGEGSAVK